MDVRKSGASVPTKPLPWTRIESVFVRRLLSYKSVTISGSVFVPMSFAAEDRTNMELAFPSKLADCTAVGLPLVIYGPEYCSLVGWACENAGVGEVVATDRSEDLDAALQRLERDPGRRIELGKRAIEVGRRYFAHEAVQRVFERAVNSVEVAVR